MSDRIRLTAGDLMLELLPALGGSVTRFDLGDRPLLRSAPADVTDVGDTGCWPLVPFVNRVRDGRFSFRGREVQLSPNLPPQKHPLHGQGWRGCWRIDSVAPAEAHLAFDHAPGEWPWAYTARQVFTLDPDGLTITLTCTNDADTPMPCGLGLHPWFPCDADTVLSAPVAGVWTVDDEVMPVETRPATGRYALQHRRISGADLDNGFYGWNGRAAITSPGFARLKMSAPVTRFQVYAPPSGEVFVAEPVTHANAALNAPEAEWRALGLRVLDPGETMSLTTRFAVTPAS